MELVVFNTRLELRERDRRRIEFLKDLNAEEATVSVAVSLSSLVAECLEMCSWSFDAFDRDLDRLPLLLFLEKRERPRIMVSSFMLAPPLESEVISGILEDNTEAARPRKKLGVVCLGLEDDGLGDATLLAEYGMVLTDVDEEEGVCLEGVTERVAEGALLLEELRSRLLEGLGSRDLLCVLER